MKKRNLKKIFKTFMFASLFPFILIPGDSGEAGSGGENNNDDNSEGSKNDDNNKGEEDPEEDPEDSSKTKTYTQKEVDKMINKRIARERKAHEKELETQKKKANMDELEKAKFEKEEAEKKANDAIDRANNSLIKSEIIAKSASLGIIDPDAAFSLINRSDIAIDKDGNISGVDEALNDLVKNKPYLLKENNSNNTNNSGGKAGDDQNKNPGGKSFSMNDLIRKAARGL